MQLVGAVTATARRWHVDELPSARYLRAEDEIVEVQAVYIADSTITVRRGIEGSTAASHDAGTVLEAPVFGAGGGEQTIRLLGPFSIAYNTPGIADVPLSVKAFDLESGQTVIRAWAVNTAFWNGTNTRLSLVVGRASALADAQNLLFDSYDPSLGGPYGDAGVYIEDYQGPASESPTTTRAATAVEADVGIYVGISGSGVSMGSADIYALIAEPAA